MIKVIKRESAYLEAKKKYIARHVFPPFLSGFPRIYVKDSSARERLSALIPAAFSATCLSLSREKPQTSLLKFPSLSM